MLLLLLFLIMSVISGLRREKKLGTASTTAVETTTGGCEPAKGADFLRTLYSDLLNHCFYVLQHQRRVTH